MRPSNEIPLTDLMPLLEVAAELRAMGNSWPAVAKRVGRSERTIQRWKKDYPDVWRQLFRKAQDDLFRHVAGKALTVMSNLVLDDKNPSQSRNVQFMIGKLCEDTLADKRIERRDAPPPVHPYWLTAIAQAEGKTPEQLKQEFVTHVALLCNQGGSNPADVPALPGPARPE